MYKIMQHDGNRWATFGTYRFEREAKEAVKSLRSQFPSYKFYIQSPDDEAFVNRCEAAEWDRCGLGYFNNLPAIKR